MASPAAAQIGINADVTVSIDVACDQVECQFDAEGSHSGTAFVMGELQVEGPGLPTGGLEASCTGATQCDTRLKGTAGTGCFLATAETETLAGGYAQTQEQAGDCSGENLRTFIPETANRASSNTTSLLPLP